MKNLTAILLLILLAGCGASPAEPAAAAADDTSGAEAPAAEAPATETQAATAPDEAKLRAHVAEHLKLPATRDDILAACAETPEFSDAEKQWIADTLAEGTYETPESVLAALGL